MRDSCSRRVSILRRLARWGVTVAAVAPATVLAPAALPAGAIDAAVPASPAATVPAALEDQRIVWLTCLDPSLYPGLPRDFYRLQ